VIAGAFSSIGASDILLQLAGLTLLEGRISPLVRSKALRNVTAKAPVALPHLRVLLKTVFPKDATPAVEPPAPVALFADPKDRPLLAAALVQQCRYLVTLSQKDFWPPPERILVVGPGDLLRLLRAQLAGL